MNDTITFFNNLGCTLWKGIIQGLMPLSVLKLVVRLKLRDSMGWPI